MPKINVNINVGFLKVIILMALISAIYFFSINIYTLNRGFSIWDEGYYLQSYLMAKNGFYPHFNNTPFVVSSFVGWASPNLIGYRVIHFILNVAQSFSLTYVLIKYLEILLGRCGRLEKYIFYAFAMFAATYSYQISVPTLSYNHLNEFFVLMSEVLIILALIERSFGLKVVIFLILSGIFASLDVFIKPPTFILLMVVNVLFIGMFLNDNIRALRYSLIFMSGVFLGALVSTVLVMSPNNWVDYLSFMRGHTTHSPYEVVSGFFASAWEMLKAGSGVIATSLLVVLMANYKRKFVGEGKLSNDTYLVSLLGLFTICVFYLNDLLLPDDIWTAFTLHWWFFWVYSSTALLAVVIVCAFGALIVYQSKVAAERRKLYLILCLLFLNPIIMAVGTVNGFGQTQMHLASWLLLIAASFIILLRQSVFEIKIYVATLVILCMSISVAYFTRQISAGNFSGYGAALDQTYRLSIEGPLHGTLVDKPTYELFTNVNSILAIYPNYPTVVFFDVPGLQYAFGRPWVVADPWLTNYEQPRTKDDLYNCHAITKHPEKIKPAIFIVARDNDISGELRVCLGKIGYPNKFKFLGSINTNVGSMTEPIKIYVNP